MHTITLSLSSLLSSSIDDIVLNCSSYRVLWTQVSPSLLFCWFCVLGLYLFCFIWVFCVQRHKSKELKQLFLHTCYRRCCELCVFSPPPLHLVACVTPAGELADLRETPSCQVCPIHQHWSDREDGGIVLLGPIACQTTLFSPAAGHCLHQHETCNQSMQTTHYCHVHLHTVGTLKDFFNF